MYRLLELKSALASYRDPRSPKSEGPGAPSAWFEAGATRRALRDAGWDKDFRTATDADSPRDSKAALKGDPAECLSSTLRFQASIFRIKPTWKDRHRIVNRPSEVRSVQIGTGKIHFIEAQRSSHFIQRKASAT